MVFTPAVRGLLGLNFDAIHHTLRLAPHLPASWSGVRVHEVPLGDVKLELDIEREGTDLLVHAISNAPTVFCIAVETEPRDVDCHAATATEHTLHVPLPGVEVELPMSRRHRVRRPGSSRRSTRSAPQIAIL